MNDCNRWQELLALRLYGEIDGPDRAQLEAHLAHCEACRACERALAEGLGPLRDAPNPAAGDVLARERLRRALEREVRPGARALAPALAGFAAGVLCAVGLVAALRERGSDVPSRDEASDAATFARATPPPATDDRGLGAALAALSRR